MLFNSIEFLFFLPIVFLFYWLVKKRLWQNSLIVIFSYIFYGWWDWRFLLLIAFTSICSYLSGLLIEKYRGRKNVEKTICISNIVINLLILGVFKYLNFFVDNIKVLFDLAGYELDWVTIRIILPVGISFYTFQALSYTIDVYRGKIRVTNDLIEFCAYISFFPQLVAGPIERATNLLPQFQKHRQFDYAKAVDGMRQMLWGFLKKLVVADNCAAIVNDYWGDPSLSGLMMLILGILFTFQIYFDFSGYSDIAIGCARLFGINLTRNFNYPYFSRNIPEFWRRWHISLMTWFRDYIYFPLGGSRCSIYKTMRNTLVVFLLSGLWHGANWTFVVWGLYHGFLIIIYTLLGFKKLPTAIVAEGRLIPSFKEVVQMCSTFVLAVWGWIIFRAENLHQISDIVHTFVDNPFIGDGFIDGKKCVVLGFALLFIEWLQKDKEHALQIESLKLFRNRATRWTLYYLIAMIILISQGSSQTFIYFQF